MQARQMVLCLVLALGWGASPATAQTLVHSNLGPEDSYSSTLTWTVRAPDHPENSYRKIAARFTPGFDTSFGSARLGIRKTAGGGTPNRFKLHLASDSGGKPGSLLETIVVTNLPTTRRLVTVQASGTRALTAGTPYWLVADADEGNAGFSWFQNTTGATGTAYTYYNNPAWTRHLIPPAPAFEVYSASESVVPEPSAVLLFLPALGVVGIIHRKRRGTST